MCSLSMGRLKYIDVCEEPLAISKENGLLHTRKLKVKMENRIMQNPVSGRR